MRPELEAIVAADEEARARVSSAEARARREVDAVAEDVARQTAERKRAADAALDHELEAIRAEGARALAALRDREAAYRESVAAAAAQRLEDAARLYARIVVDGPPEGRR